MFCYPICYTKKYFTPHFEILDKFHTLILLLLMLCSLIAGFPHFLILLHNHQFHLEGTVTEKLCRCFYSNSFSALFSLTSQSGHTADFEVSLQQVLLLPFSISFCLSKYSKTASRSLTIESLFIRSSSICLRVRVSERTILSTFLSHSVSIHLNSFLKSSLLKSLLPSSIELHSVR